MRPGQVRGPHRARLRGGVEIRDLAGTLPCEVFSRLSRATRRSQVRCRNMSPAARTDGVSDCLLMQAAGYVGRSRKRTID